MAGHDMRFPNEKGFRTKAILFDCDGVLIDSVSRKTNAFREWVTAFFPEQTAPFLSYHLGAYGTSRNKQLEHFFKNILKAPVDANLFELMLSRLDALIDANMQNVQLIPGVAETLDCLMQMQIALYVVSGAPQDELEGHLRRLNVYGKFRRVIGASVGKEEAVRRIMEAEACASEEMFLVGDATTDAVAAARWGIRFVYYPSSAKMESAHIWRKITGLKDILSYV